MAQSEFRKVLCACSQLGYPVVGLASCLLHKLKERLGHAYVGGRAKVQIHRVEASEGLERKAEHLILEVYAHAVVVLQAVEELAGIHVGVHEGGLGAAIHSVVLPSGFHVEDECLGPEIACRADVHVAQEGEADVTVVEQSGVHLMPQVRRLHEVGGSQFLCGGAQRCGQQRGHDCYLVSHESFYVVMFHFCLFSHCVGMCSHALRIS